MRFNKFSVSIFCECVCVSFSFLVFRCALMETPTTNMTLIIDLFQNTDVFFRSFVYRGVFWQSSASFIETKKKSLPFSWFFSFFRSHLKFNYERCDFSSKKTNQNELVRCLNLENMRSMIFLVIGDPFKRS